MIPTTRLRASLGTLRASLRRAGVTIGATVRRRLEARATGARGVSSRPVTRMAVASSHRRATPAPRAIPTPRAVPVRPVASTGAYRALWGASRASSRATWQAPLFSVPDGGQLSLMPDPRDVLPSAVAPWGVAPVASAGRVAPGGTRGRAPGVAGAHRGLGTTGPTMGPTLGRGCDTPDRVGAPPTSGVSEVDTPDRGVTRPGIDPTSPGTGNRQ